MALCCLATWPPLSPSSSHCPLCCFNLFHLFGLDATHCPPCNSAVPSCKTHRCHTAKALQQASPSHCNTWRPFHWPLAQRHQWHTSLAASSTSAMALLCTHANDGAAAHLISHWRRSSEMLWRSDEANALPPAHPSGTQHSVHHFAQHTLGCGGHFALLLLPNQDDAACPRIDLSFFSSSPAAGNLAFAQPGRWVGAFTANDQSPPALASHCESQMD